MIQQEGIDGTAGENDFRVVECGQLIGHHDHLIEMNRARHNLALAGAARSSASHLTRLT
jgi:hypothetical protein